MSTSIRLKEALANRELTIGSWLSWGFSPITEVMAKSGFDWLVIDVEHTAIDYAEMHQMIQTIDLAGCVPLVRVGDNDPLIIKRALDSGAAGVIIPMINTAEQASKAVSAAYYPPKGTRGVGLSRAQDYGMGFPEYRERSLNETIVIVQIEHVDAVANLEAILAVDGVDGFIVGPYDLSGSVNQPGNFDHPEVKAALEKVEKVMRSSGKPGGIHVVHTDHKQLRVRIEAGYSFIAYGDDMVFFAEKMRDESAFLRSIREK
ncbi:MAG: aldolase/citrate lyase family protein [bacterium]